MKKKQITLIVLGAVLAVLVLLYFFVIAPLIDGDESSSSEPPYVAEGEALYLNSYLCMYPSINENDVITITVNNENGTVNLYNKIDEDSGSLELFLVNYPYLDLDDTALSYLRVYTLDTQCVSNEPIRDCDEETMRKYGVTADTAQATYTVVFEEDGVEKSHTVYIGNKSLNTKGAYFATVAGRNVIYEIPSDLEYSMFLAQEDYINPLICSAFSSSEVVYDIQRIMIGYANEDVPYIGIASTKNETEDSIMIKHSVLLPTNALGVAANSTYISNALTSLLVSFSGDKVVAIDPDEETLDRYGLGANDKRILASVRTYDLIEYNFHMSSEIAEEDGSYYYVLITPLAEKDTRLVIRVPSTGYEFLKEENAIKWVATNSVESGFRKYIKADEDDGESGVQKIEIFCNNNALKDFRETFNLVYSVDEKTGKDVLTVTSESGKYEFVTDVNAELAEDRNQFNRFYAMFISYPYPMRFNTMSAEEKDAVRTEENLIFEMKVTLNDGTEIGYSYYRIDAANVMCEFYDETHPEPTVVFDTTSEQISILTTALVQLINGEKVEWR